ncbi:MAG: BREX-1 system adenine-specific DNA-methyltransferase PglX [Clostridium sp.]|nr:BREX-1 system adenine-specific DNA-methyltransferase PglX [Clostridium sp.]
MDKSKIKAFAVWARRAMIQAVQDRAFKIGIEENKIHEIERLQGGFKVVGREEIFNISPSHRDKLVGLVKEKGYEQVIEETAYTWFNRFMGLRYMEVNDYLPTGIRILSSEEEGKKEPDVLSKVNDIADDLNLDMNYVYELHDKNTEGAREELYKYILVRQCNELGNIIPQMFEKIQDYTELLLPDNLLQDGSVIRKMVEDIEEEDWREEVEIIGWMYQYYISEKKDEVFAALKKNVKITKENIPAATQLFTPKWIVKYMVENSLGRLWLEGHPNEELQEEWKYYLEEAEQESEVEEELKKIREEHSKLTPEDIKVLDPCMGSGHILVYAFDVLYEIYKSEGYSEREIPRLILQNNLYGLDIDDRAAQLASFALIMKARHYNRRLFREIEREELDLNFCSIQESNGISEEAISYFANGNKQLKEDIQYLVDVFTDAKEYGSIIEVKKINFNKINNRLVEIKNDENLMFGDYKKVILDIIPKLIKQSRIISRKYDICITNPPYMNTSGASEKLRKVLNIEYNFSKADLFAVFMEKAMKFINNFGIYSMINQHSWMFISSYTDLRKKIINSECTINMLHLGQRSFDDIGGEVVQSTTFIQRKYFNKKYKSIYVRLTDYNTSKDKEKEYFNVLSGEHKNLYKINTYRLSSLPSYSIAYWINNKLLSIFTSSDDIKSNFECKSGIMTGKDPLFLRIWPEVNYENIKLNANSYKEMDGYKWFPLNKGGSNRRYFGNNDYIINLKNEGEDIKKTSTNFRLRDKKYYFKNGITWSRISTGNISFREVVKGSLFGDAGPMMFINENDDRKYILGLLNSKIIINILYYLNPTMNYQVNDIENIPVVYDYNNKKEIIHLVEQNVKIAKLDWDLFETSWEFKRHPLLTRLNGDDKEKINSAFSTWKLECEETVKQLKNNEEELNRIFINIYGLQDELTPEVDDKDITIRKADRERDIKSFISYAVGCIFGRYSIDAEGLIYAGGNFSDKWQVTSDKCLVRDVQKDEDGNVVSDTWVETRFSSDVDNIIPITEDEYFEDDIVSRFIEFVRTVYGGEYLEENIDFIADSIGKKSTETSRQAIRRYFIKDFYKDHLKVYQKRPIYWMFDSGKNDGFKALIYMHRYDESTVAKLRTDYLHQLQRKYESEIIRQQQLSESASLSAREKTAAKKKIDRINKQIEEIKLYDQVVAHIANERISIDLDDGVKHNYALFQGVKVPTDSGKEVKMDLLAKI